MDCCVYCEEKTDYGCICDKCANRIGDSYFMDYLIGKMVDFLGYYTVSEEEKKQQWEVMKFYEVAFGKGGYMREVV